MLKSIEGIFRDGRVELLEPPPPEQGETRVVVTFMTPPSNTINLPDRGIDPQQAAELRARLKSVAEDWNRPEMDVYDEP